LPPTLGVESSSGQLQVSLGELSRQRRLELGGLVGRRRELPRRDSGGELGALVGEAGRGRGDGACLGQVEFVGDG